MRISLLTIFVIILGSIGVSFGALLAYGLIQFAILYGHISAMILLFGIVAVILNFLKFLLGS